jgi:acetyl esterase/lipase
VKWREAIALVALILAACDVTNAARGPRAATRPTTTSKPILPAPPPGVTIEQDLTFLTPERKEKLDLYLPTDNASVHPAIVVIHGGGWVGGDKADARQFNIATDLAKSGYVCVSVNYQMDAEAGRWPTNLHDCKNAVRFLRKNAEKYKVDAEHIGVIGGSAGGHLSLMVGYTTDVKDLEPEAPYPGISDRVSAVVDLYGITNLLTRRKTDADGNPTGELFTQAALMPGSPRTDETAWKHASPVTYVTPLSPPTLILQGLADTTVDRDQSSELAGVLMHAGVEFELITLKGIGHTFDLETWKRQPLPRDLRPVVVAYFDRHLRAKTAK